MISRGRSHYSLKPLNMIDCTFPSCLSCLLMPRIVNTLHNKASDCFVVKSTPRHGNGSKAQYSQIHSFLFAMQPFPMINWLSGCDYGGWKDVVKWNCLKVVFFFLTWQVNLRQTSQRQSFSSLKNQTNTFTVDGLESSWRLRYWHVTNKCRWYTHLPARESPLRASHSTFFK